MEDIFKRHDGSFFQTLENEGLGANEAHLVAHTEMEGAGSTPSGRDIQDRRTACHIVRAREAPRSVSPLMSSRERKAADDEIRNTFGIDIGNLSRQGLL